MNCLSVCVGGGVLIQILSDDTQRKGSISTHNGASSYISSYLCCLPYGTLPCNLNGYERGGRGEVQELLAPRNVTH